MVVRLLLLIKHRLPWLWTWVEWLNARLYHMLHIRRMQVEVARAFAEFTLAGFEFRPLEESDLNALHKLIEHQGADRLEYFQPHGFDHASLMRMHANPAFLMFGAFHKQQLVGYFFLRCFWNRKCFVGRLIDQPFERRGIGRVMNQIMYHIAWRSGFRCMTTVSKNNHAIMRSHERNPHAEIVRELGNDYLLIEFMQKPGVDEK